jgi:hypothetical protein
MSPEHKAALVLGRTQGRAVRAYLEALELNKPKRGRPRTSETVGRQIENVTAEIATANPLRRLELVQKRIDLIAEKEALSAEVDMTELEANFVLHAAEYGNRKGLTYKAWREVGVSTEILKKAGIGRQ